MPGAEAVSVQYPALSITNSLPLTEHISGVEVEYEIGLPVEIE